MSFATAASQKSVWGFSPQSIPGLQLWLDAADTTSITGTSPVTAWRDKSGNGNNATATGSPALTQNAINGVQAISTAVGTYFRGSVPISGTTLTCFAVATTNVTLPNLRNPRRDQRLVSLANGTNPDYASNGLIALFNQDNTSTIAAFDYPNFLGRPSNPIVKDIPFLAVTHFNGTTASLWFNGSAGTVPTSAYSTSFSITKYGIGEQAGVVSPNNENWSGFFGEIILFNTALTTSERQQVEGYLAAKWGLKANLPATHPYSTGSIIPFNRPFYPTDIPGCSLWLDGADTSSMTFSSGSSVSSWRDKSGNGNTATSAGSANPILTQNLINGAQGISLPNAGTTPNPTYFFDGPISLTGTSITYFVVCVPSSTTVMAGGSPRILSLGATSALDYTSALYLVALYQYNTSFGVYRNGGATPISVVANTPYIFSAIATSGNVGMYQNGGTVTDITVPGTGNFSISRFRIGNEFNPQTNLFNGNIGEIIVFNTSLSTPQRQQVEQYLTWKWRFSLGPLATGHPGKLLPAFSTNFTVKSISGCQLWLDGADTTSMIRSGTTVTTWRDKSGNAGDAIATGSPTSAGSGVVFPNTGIYFTLNTPYASTHTIYIVCTTTVASQAYLFGRNYASSAPAFITNYTGSSLEYYDDPRGRYTLAATPTSTFIASYIRTFGTSLALRYNGSQVGTQASPTTSENTSINWGYLGSATTTAGFYSGTMYEFMIFNAALTIPQAQQVEGYLAWKWGLQSSLPSTHAYAKFSP